MILIFRFFNNFLGGRTTEVKFMESLKRQVAQTFILLILFIILKIITTTYPGCTAVMKLCSFAITSVIEVLLIFLQRTSRCKVSKFCYKHFFVFFCKIPYPDTRPLFSIRILLCLLHQITKLTEIRAPSIAPMTSPPICAGVNWKEPLFEKEHCQSL